MSMPTVGLSAIAASADCGEGVCNASCALAATVKTRFDAAKTATLANQRSMFPSPDLIRVTTLPHDAGVSHADGKIVISCNVDDRKLEGNPALRVAGFGRV